MSAWYGKSLPDDYSLWEKTLTDKYETDWKEKGSPTGIRLNDHNYNTVLGQGNTLGFVAATLDIDTPAHLRHGLFKDGGQRNALVRFSDFGADGGPNVARMAV